MCALGALAAAPAGGTVQGDFDGDGRGDLAIGAPGENVGGGANAGAVTIVYSGATGLRPQTARLFSENTKGVPGTPGSTDRFGTALAAGDFDRDHEADLAIGVPGRSVAGESGAGAVVVLYGTKHGLRARGSRAFTQNTKEVEDHAEAADLFGGVLETGDFNGDARDDLAVGVGQANLNGENGGAGAVEVLYGSGKGLRTKADQLWTQDSPGVADAAEGADFFGGALASGDLGRGKRDDLAIGVPAEALAGGFAAGAVNVLYGTPKRLRAKGDQFFSQDDPTEIAGDAEPGDLFGSALTSGDFDHDGHADLGVGVPREDFGAVDVGAVNVIYGSATGLVPEGNRVFLQGQPGLGDSAEAGDMLGSSLASGRFDAGRTADLAAGDPGEDAQAGGVNVVYGSPTGLASNDYTIMFGAAAGEGQGAALGAGRFGEDSRGDLAAGLPGDTGATGGRIAAFYGRPAGLGFGAVDYIDQGDPGIPSAGTAFDRFGAALAP
jgi:hypothetical protein